MRQITNAAKLHLKVERQQIGDLEEPDDLNSAAMASLDGGPPVEADRKVRREIANSNERRRMQSINSGFQNLKTLLPHHEGEKMSKATILQQTADYVKRLEEDKKHLEVQNSRLQRAAEGGHHTHRVAPEIPPAHHQLPRVVEIPSVHQQLPRAAAEIPPAHQGAHQGSLRPAGAAVGLKAHSPTPKRRRRENTESSDEGIVMGGDHDDYEELRREVSRLRSQLGLEKQRMMALEQYCMIFPTGYQYQPPMKLSEFSPPALPAHPFPAPAHVAPAAMAAAVAAAAAATDTLPQVLPTQAPANQPAKPASSQAPSTPVNHTVSQKNLQTIVQAIEQIEGPLEKPASSAATSSGTSEIDSEEIKSDESECPSPAARSSIALPPPAHVSLKHTVYQPTALAPPVGGLPAPQSFFRPPSTAAVYYP